MEKGSNQYLGTKPLGKLMRQYALPCIISLLVGALYNIVDQIFIANASYLGSYGNAANTVVFPLTVIALAIAVMAGDGCCAFVSISLGKGEQKTAKKSVGNAVVLIVIFSVILMVVYLFRMKNIKPAKDDFRLQRAVCKSTLTMGITSFLSQISLVAAMAAINNMLRKYGAADAVFGQEQYAQIPMAVVGIVMKFFQIVISVVVGMDAGCIPIAGFNMGAGKRLRVRDLFTRLLRAPVIQILQCGRFVSTFA